MNEWIKETSSKTSGNYDFEHNKINVNRRERERERKKKEERMKKKFYWKYIGNIKLRRTRNK
jgi:hypothetical protein